jgi:hypothetical protein
VTVLFLSGENTCNVYETAGTRDRRNIRNNKITVVREEKERKQRREQNN